MSEGEQFKYMLSTTHSNGCAVFIRRNYFTGIDIQVTDYMDSNMFGISRIKSSWIREDELAVLGYKEIDENDFNDAFINATNCILGIKESIKRKGLDKQA